MWQNVVVTVLVALGALLLGRSVYRALKGSDTCSGCRTCAQRGECEARSDGPDQDQGALPP